jgi:Fur family ferric uptake transcriptional regulator
MNENILKSTDLKATKKRMAILMLLEKTKSPMTAEEIYKAAVNDINMNLSTTYRTLAILSEKGILLKNLSHDGKTYYQINNHQHKHQLVCNICNEVVPISTCPLTELEESLQEKTGFTITGHSLEFSGICPKCSKHIKE